VGRSRAGLFALVLLAARPASRRLSAARLLALLVVIVGGIGVYKHVDANYEAGPTEREYDEQWASMSEAERWWAAASGGTGDTAPFAPSAIAFSGVLILASTWRPTDPSRLQARAG
jgi:hypothetical protein